MQETKPKEKVMLAELITGRILRHNYSTTLGLHIKSVIPLTGDLYIIKCKYLSLKNNNKGMQWDHTENSFTMPLIRFMKEFSVLENKKQMKSYEDGNWIPMTDLQLLANSNGKVIV